MPVKNTFQIENLSEVMKQTRKLAHLTQNQLAEMAGVGKTLIFDIEKGQKKVSLEKLIKVCQALNIKLELKLPLELEIDE